MRPVCRAPLGGNAGLLAVVASLPAAALASPGATLVVPCGHCPAQGTLPLAAWRLCRLAVAPGKGPPRGSKDVEVLQSLRQVGSWDHIAKPPAAVNGVWPASPRNGNSSNENLSDDMVTLNVSAEVQTEHEADFSTGARATGRKGPMVPVLMLLTVGIAVCGYMTLWNSQTWNSRRSFRHRAVPPQPQGYLETPAPSVQSLGGSNEPSFGSRPATALSAGSAAGLPHGSPLGSTRESTCESVVHFGSFKAVADKGHPKPGEPGPADSEVTPLKPLCRALVLPNHETHLLVQLSSLEKAAKSGGEFHILGVLGNRLLRAEVRRTEGGQALDVFTVSATDTLPRNTRALTIVSSSDGSCEIQGVDGKHYGELLCRAGALSVYCPGQAQPVLVLTRDAAGLQLMANAGKDGHLLALGKRSCTNSGDGEQLELRTCPGVDTALVLACILAMFLFF